MWSFILWRRKLKNIELEKKGNVQLCTQRWAYINTNTKLILMKGETKLPTQTKHLNWSLLSLQLSLSLLAGREILLSRASSFFTSFSISIIRFTTQFFVSICLQSLFNSSFRSSNDPKITSPSRGIVLGLYGPKDDTHHDEVVDVLCFLFCLKWWRNLCEQERKPNEAEGCAAEGSLQMEEEARNCSISCILLRELSYDAVSVWSGYDAGVVASSIGSGTENCVSVHSSEPASVGHSVGYVFSGNVFNVVLMVNTSSYGWFFWQLLLMISDYLAFDRGFSVLSFYRNCGALRKDFLVSLFPIEFSIRFFAGRGE